MIYLLDHWRQDIRMAHSSKPSLGEGYQYYHVLGSEPALPPKRKKSLNGSPTAFEDRRVHERLSYGT